MADDIVGVVGRLVDGGSVGFMTWGRVLGDGDPPLVELVLGFARTVSVSSMITAVERVDSLAGIRDSVYFYEALVYFTAELARARDDEAWRSRTRTLLLEEKEIYFCGPISARSIDPS